MLIEVFPRDRESLIAILPEYEGERVPVPVHDLIGMEIPAPEGVSVRFTDAMRDEAEGRRLLKAYLDASRAHRDAVGRARILKPGERIVPQAITEETLAEWRRRREALDTAHDAYEAWWRAEADLNNS